MVVSKVNRTLFLHWVANEGDFQRSQTRGRHCLLYLDYVRDEFADILTVDQAEYLFRQATFSLLTPEQQQVVVMKKQRTYGVKHRKRNYCKAFSDNRNKNITKTNKNNNKKNKSNKNNIKNESSDVLPPHPCNGTLHFCLLPSQPNSPLSTPASSSTFFSGVQQLRIILDEEEQERKKRGWKSFGEEWGEFLPLFGGSWFLEKGGGGGCLIDSLSKKGKEGMGGVLRKFYRERERGKLCSPVFLCNQVGDAVPFLSYNYP